MRFFGIGLGTSNTMLAELSFQDGVVGITLLENSRGDVTLPSVIHFQENGEVLVGSAARAFLAEAPESTFELMSVRSGLENFTLCQIGEQKIKVSPQQVISNLLKFVRSMPTADVVSRAVLTIPVGGDDYSNRATLQAASIAEIDVVELLEEPNAAILYHLYATHATRESVKDIIGKKYLVFDYGGSSLDLALVHVQREEDGSARPTVITSLANQRLGGCDIDFAFMGTVLEEIGDDFSQHLFFQNAVEEFYFFQNKGFLRCDADAKVKRFLSDLKTEIEHTKIQLTFKERHSISFSHPDFDPVDVDRPFFEEEILERHFKGEIYKSLDSFSKQLGGKEEIDEIVMVGGSSQIPYIKQLLEYYFRPLELDGRIVAGEDYATAVARGAAIQSALRAGVIVPPFGARSCNNVLAHDIYIEHMGKTKLLLEHGTTCPLEEQNSTLCRFEILYALQESIRILVKEVCDRYDEEKDRVLRFEKVIGDMKFFHPFFYHGDTVIVKALLDDNGILRFKAVHEATGEQIEFEAQEACQLNSSES